MKPGGPLRGLTLGLVVGAAAWAFQARAQTRSPPFQMPRSTMAAPGSSHVPAVGPLPDLAFGAYQRGSFLTALSEATKRVAANPKDAAAMTLIGEIYRDGLAVRQDVAEAVHWYRLASALGDKQAALSVGSLLCGDADHGGGDDRAMTDLLRMHA